MTRKTVIYTSRPKEKFLSIRLLATACWTSWFALQWCRIFGLGDQLVIMKTFWGHLILAILCSLLTYGMNVNTDKNEEKHKHGDTGDYVH